MGGGGSLSLEILRGGGAQAVLEIQVEGGGEGAKNRAFCQGHVDFFWHNPIKKNILNQGQLTPPTGSPSQITPYCHLQAPPPPAKSYSLGNETEIEKHMKTLELKKVNERIHQLRKKCLIMQTRSSCPNFQY